MNPKASMLPVKVVVNIASRSASDKMIHVHAALHFHKPTQCILPHRGAHSPTVMGLYRSGFSRLEYTEGSLVIPLGVSV